MKLRLLLSTLLCAFLFTANSQITTVGLIGDATPGGWDTDTDMIQDAVDTSLWTLDVTLIAGEAKFRTNDDWAVNWGETDFPTGIGVAGGPNIPVFAGDYSITFNSITGEYNFAVNSTIGIIGSATAGGWDTDTDMYKDTTEHGFFVTLDLVGGEAKFRQDNDWAINWGSTDFPSGIATVGGDNIPVPAGKYLITFDTMSGAYNFETIIEFTSISIFGDATASADVDLTQDTGNADLWNGNVTLVDGGLKFRADHADDTSWGGTDFPAGTATAEGGDIPGVAGDYQVTFNTATGAYEFLIIENYSTIGIIGDATPGGWDADTDMVQDAIDSALWVVRLTLTDGEAKFRAEDDWTVNWGAGDFPSGIATQDGANIPVVAGEYKVTFHSITGAYNFELIVVFNTVGIIGTGSPTGGWDDDTDLTQNADDEHLWEYASMTLTDGEVKFRAEDDWTVNWGAVDFPAGVGTQDGPNIIALAGVYDISINTNLGEYLFADPVGTREEILSPNSVNVFPNPASDKLNIDVSELNLKGEVQITIVDMAGRNVMTQTLDASATMQLDVADLATGNYLLQITNTKYIIGKRFSIVK